MTTHLIKSTKRSQATATKVGLKWQLSDTPAEAMLQANDDLLIILGDVSLHRGILPRLTAILHDLRFYNEWDMIVLGAKNIKDGGSVKRQMFVKLPTYCHEPYCYYIKRSSIKKILAGYQPVQLYTRPQMAGRPMPCMDHMHFFQWCSDPIAHRPIPAWKRRLLIVNGWSLGDEVLNTACIRDIHRAFPGEFLISVSSQTPEVFYGLGVVDLEGIPDYVWNINVHRQKYSHLIQGFNKDASNAIGRDIPLSELRPHLVLSDEERKPIIDQPYWVMAAGYKVDCTSKAWPEKNWQKVVDHFKGRITFVQLGGEGIEHIPRHLKGTIDLTGKTSVRECFSIVGNDNCLGVVSPITGILHVAAAFSKPSVTLVGAREDDWVSRYPHNEWLRTYPPCENCWRLRVRPLGPKFPYQQYDQNLCKMPDGDFASCMTALKPESVIDAIERRSYEWQLVS